LSFLKYKKDTINNLKMNKNKISIPKDGIAGLKENFKADAISGFIVFLLALPLSLGIAKASEFPPVTGLLTAIIGGIIVSLFMGSHLSIKGPAAGLIVIVASAVADFGGGEIGWRMACGIMVVAGLVQVLFGFLKLGILVDFFPLSTIHGMMAAIGLIIILKQIPVLLDVNPLLTKGKSPFELLLDLPFYLKNLDVKATLIGVISLWIMMTWQNNSNKILRMIPAPLVVLLFAIPVGLMLDYQHTEPAYALLHIGNLLEYVKYNANFDGLSQIGLFIKYVIMFALVGSLESLLTVKAVDILDPYKRKSNNNKDLIAVGIGNTIAAFFGGLPMISEVARSSANVKNGAKTRWANFFHGFFILFFILLALPLIEMIPNTALAAMLISVGIKLAHPKELIHMYQIGKEQAAIFLITIIVTLAEDLLVGIAAGVSLKILFHLYNGAPLSSIFKTHSSIAFTENEYVVTIKKSAIFTNLLGIMGRLKSIPFGKVVTIDLNQTKLIDHSVMECLDEFKQNYEANGGTVQIIGLENHKAFSNHSFSSRKKHEK
jgi:MFS superfamily sulfate permease-like transporter